uniref:AAA+ ATPase domain-containing protein n=1 Tax=Platysiphonia delicata TaxID=2006979 RepID=A0A1Z1M1G2_9FLOR|nr:hypothetical protein [Platysiphonia delicata]ARW59613.1 hypothetical protein [Platysiphonia delicata]
MLIADDLNKLLQILPDFVKKPLQNHDKSKYLIEVVIDLGRQPEARFPDGPEYLSNTLVSYDDLNFCIKKIGNFSGDNRSGIECTLHRISSIKNKNGNIVGLTCRVGRAIFGTISLIRDLLYTGESILLLGKPGVGKTTAIREIARTLADEMEKRVVIIDTSNEIAGDGDVPHPAIGRARRMQVSRPELQHKVMIEAVENHMPEVIIIDEIGTELEAMAARTIAERGVQLVGTAHGNYLESLIKNPVLTDLVGGIQYVTLGDDEAKRRCSQKSILERKSIPAFQIAIEIHERNNWIVHENVDSTIDKILQGSFFFIQRRKLNFNGSISILSESFISKGFVAHYMQNELSINSSSKKRKHVIDSNHKISSHTNLKMSKNFINELTYNNLVRNIKSNINTSNKLIQLYVYCINIQHISSVINNLNFAILLTRDIMKADAILALRNHVKRNDRIRLIARSRQIVIYTINGVTFNNILRVLKEIISFCTMFCSNYTKSFINRNFIDSNAILTTCLATENLIILKKQFIKLLPQPFNLEKLQSQLISLCNLKYNNPIKVLFRV